MNCFGEEEHDKLNVKLFSSALHPFDLRPFFLRAEDKKGSVITLATICNHKRKDMLPFLAERWDGPISIAYHLKNGPKLESEIQELKEMYQGNIALKKRASIHLVVDNHPLQLNLWRNIARLYSSSPSVLIVDVEFVPDLDLHSYVKRNWDKMEKMMKNKVAFVLPAYEFVDEFDLNVEIPETKSELLELVEQNQARMFHSYWYHGQGHTNHQKWETTTEMYSIETYHFKYEPYLIYPQTAPFCDERFVGYGSNKCACVYELVVAGYDLKVLPESFVIHRPHGEYALTPEEQEKRNNENLMNIKTLRKYMEDMEAKYGSIILKKDKPAS